MLNFTPDSTDTTLCSSSDLLIDDYNSLPRLDLNSSVSSISHLTNSDVDLHMPSDVNFNYYSSSDFRNNQEISNCLSENAFSFLHCNIRSLSANKNKLEHLLYLYLYCCIWAKFVVFGQILSIVDKIHEGIEKGMFSCGIFLDFSKAFDTVNHSILIRKLEHYGVRGIAKDWIVSYLSNRGQFTSIGATNSEDLPISCGVPQGSVLGPLLFLIYINDFSNCTDTLDLCLFADDSNLFFCHKNLLSLESIINSELSYVKNWLNTNKLSLNIGKSNFVLFHPPQKKVNTSVKLYINDIPLEEKSHVKYLGIMLDTNLNWKSHVHYISKKVKRSIGFLSKIRYHVNLDVLTNLYYALIYPFLIYGIVIWGNT